jgi:hypothetical protein
MMYGEFNNSGMCLCTVAPCHDSLLTLFSSANQMRPPMGFQFSVFFESGQYVNKLFLI